MTINKEELKEMIRPIEWKELDVDIFYAKNADFRVLKDKFGRWDHMPTDFPRFSEYRFDTKEEAIEDANQSYIEEILNKFDFEKNKVYPSREDELDYYFQDDLHNRLTPRVIDLAYTAFMKAKDTNDEDGGPTDWFTDTKPIIMKGIEKIRKECKIEKSKWRR